MNPTSIYPYATRPAKTSTSPNTAENTRCKITLSFREHNRAQIFELRSIIKEHLDCLLVAQKDVRG